MKTLPEYIEACKKELPDFVLYKTEREVKALMTAMIMCGGFAYGDESRIRIAHEIAREYHIQIAKIGLS